MKFGFILTDFSGGGAEKAVLNICLGLKDRNHEVVIYIFNPNHQYVLPKGLKVVLISSKLKTGLLKKRILAYQLNKEINFESKKAPFDLTISTLPYADEIAYYAKLKNHFFRVANTLSAEIEKLKYKNRLKAYKRWIRYKRIYSKNVIAVSSGVKDDLQTYFGTSLGNIEVIYNPFNFHEIRKLAKENFEQPDYEYLIHIGRFSPQKRHDVLLNAFLKVDEKIKLVLLTEKNENLNLLIKSKNLQDRVVIPGFQKNPYKWIKNAKLLVLSSDFEGMPNVLIESLIVGTPVVSTDCPSGPKEILDSEVFSKFLVPIADPESLSRAINNFLENESYPSIDLGKFNRDISLSKYESLGKN